MASAKPNPGVWGIDIGQCALKAIRLEQVEGGGLVATAFDYVEHPKILSQPDADPDQLTRAALETFLSRNQTRGDQIAISVPGQTGLARFVKLPPVEAKKIPDIVKFEAKQQIPFPLDEVVWDWQTIGSEADAPAEGFVESEIGLFAMKKDMINRYLQAFTDLKVEVHYIQMAPLALCNFVAHDLIDKTAAKTPGARSCVVAVDLGADNTSLIITDGDKIIWQRPIPIGGNHFTRALTKDLKLTFAKAEHVKRNAVKAEDPKRIFQVMKPVFTDFVSELKRSLGFFTNTHRDAKITKVIALGNAFRLPGLQRFVSQSLELELEKLESFPGLQGNDEVLTAPTYKENLLSFAVAYGAALQGLHVSMLRTNLLPPDIQFDRVLRAKKPWLAAAAASLLLGTFFHAYILSAEEAKATEAEKRIPKVQQAVSAKNSKKSAFDAELKALNDAVEQSNNLKRDEQWRKNWLTIHRYINDALPQPDGTNLIYYDPPTDPRNLRTGGTRLSNYYYNERAKSAFDSMRKRTEDGQKEKINLSQLTQVNIQGVWLLYCTPEMAKNYYNNLKNPREAKDKAMDFVSRRVLRDSKPADTGEEDPDWKSGPPTKPGYAVEIWGYTYHEANQAFVKDTLIPKLRSLRNEWRFGNEPFSATAKMDVSHVAIYRIRSPEEWDPKRFELINQGKLYIKSLVGGGTGTEGDPRPGMAPPPMPTGDGAGEGSPPPPTGTPRDSAWIGIGSLLTGAGTTGATPGPMTGPTPDPTTGPPKGDSKKMPRTEFVIVLYWADPMAGELAGPTSDGSSSAPPPGGEYPGMSPDGVPPGPIPPGS